jgi:glycosyltransferase involved in cell wall biosynthesis
MDSARILLLTSYREGFALPPLEGMARGLPTVLFRCGGPDQYAIDGRNAIYVDSEAGAAHAVEKLIADPVMYERMRQEAILTAAEYRLDRSFASMAAFIGECSQW